MVKSEQRREVEGKRCLFHSKPHLKSLLQTMLFMWEVGRSPEFQLMESWNDLGWKASKDQPILAWDASPMLFQH